MISRCLVWRGVTWRVGQGCSQRILLVKCISPVISPAGPASSATNGYAEQRERNSRKRQDQGSLSDASAFWWSPGARASLCYNDATLASRSLLICRRASAAGGRALQPGVTAHRSPPPHLCLSSWLCVRPSALRNDRPFFVFPRGPLKSGYLHRRVKVAVYFISFIDKNKTLSATYKMNLLWPIQSLQL